MSEVTIEEMLRHKEVGKARDAMHRAMNFVEDDGTLNDHDFCLLLKLSGGKSVTLIELHQMSGFRKSKLLIAISRMSERGYLEVDDFFSVSLSIETKIAIDNANHQWLYPNAPSLC